MYKKGDFFHPFRKMEVGCNEKRVIFFILSDINLSKFVQKRNFNMDFLMKYYKFITPK